MLNKKPNLWILAKLALIVVVPFLATGYFLKEFKTCGGLKTINEACTSNCKMVFSSDQLQTLVGQTQDDWDRVGLSRIQFLTRYDIIADNSVETIPSQQFPNIPTSTKIKCSTGEKQLEIKSGEKVAIVMGAKGEKILETLRGYQCSNDIEIYKPSDQPNFAPELKGTACISVIPSWDTVALVFVLIFFPITMAMIRISKEAWIFIVNNDYFKK